MKTDSVSARKKSLCQDNMTSTTRPTFMEPIPKRRKMSDSTPVYTLHVRVFENNQEAVISHYTVPEISSLTYVAEEMFKEPFGSDTRIYFNVNLVDAEHDEDDDDYGSDLVVTCHMDIGLPEATQIPIPKEWLKRTLRQGFRATDKTYNLVGDKIPIRPPQWGFSPWPDNICMQFVPAEEE